MAEKAERQPQELSEILQIRRDKLDNMQKQGNDPYLHTRFDVDHKAQEILDRFDELEGKEVRVAGRIMSRRGMGKVAFMDLQDSSGRVQIYAKIDVMGEEPYKAMQATLDIGDIVGVKGEVFRTQRGEISVKALELTILSKALLPLPEKYHGLTNTDARYRQRYLDLIMSPESREVFVRRSKIISAIRTYLDSREFWRWRPRCCTPRRAARRRGHLSPTTTPLTWTCTCASPWSCTLSG